MENVRRLRFVPVGAANRAQAERIAPAPGQEGFIESVRECLAEADALALWRPVCVYDGALLIGFAMYGLFPTPAPGRLWLDRLLIDGRYQGRGYGRRAVAGLIERLAAEYPCERVYLSVYAENARAVQLYRRFGFRFNGERDTKGELVMERRLR